MCPWLLSTAEPCQYQPATRHAQSRFTVDWLSRAVSQPVTDHSPSLLYHAAIILQLSHNVSSAARSHSNTSQTLPVWTFHTFIFFSCSNFGTLFFFSLLFHCVHLCVALSRHLFTLMPFLFRSCSVSDAFPLCRRYKNRPLRGCLASPPLQFAVAVPSPTLILSLSLNTFSLMNSQMILVISSPSISTTGWATLMRLSASVGRGKRNYILYTL